MLFVSLAWRNIQRNRRRTALTVAAIAIGVASLVFAWALFDGSNNQSINNMTGTFTGHVQVHRQGYTDDPSLDRTFGADEVDLAHLKSVPGVVAASPRVQNPVLISTDANSRGVLVVGVDPEREPLVTKLQTKMLQGHYFERGEKGGILLGSSLAKTLRAEVGSEVAVLTQGMNGSIGAAKYRVIGIYGTGNEMVDGLQAFISLNDANDLFSSEGHYTSIAVKLTNYGKSDDVVNQFHSTLKSDLEIEGWKQLLPDVAQTVNFHEWVATIIMVILFGIVMIGVANTILMSVFERLREFGVMMAMGTNSRQVFRTIVYEGALIGLLGFGVGLLIGYGAVAHFGTVGIDFSSQKQAVQSLQGVTSKLYPYLSFGRMLFIAASVLFVTVGAALYPAIRTSLLLPLQAIRGQADQGYRAVGVVKSSGKNLLMSLGLRNVMRHPLRTFLTGFGVAFAMAAFVFLSCFVVGYYRQIVENSTGFITGDGQVQHQDFRVELKPELQIEDSAGIVKTLEAMPEIKSVSPRVQTPAMVSSPRSAEPILLIGVKPELEKKVTFLYKSVKIGSYLNPDADHEVVLGRKLAERLHVEIGDKVVVMAQDVHNQLVSEAFVVTGLFATGSHGFDETMAHISLPALQRMLGMGSHYSTVAFRVSNPDMLPQTLDLVRSRIHEPTAKVYSWQDLLPQVAQMNVMFKGSLVLVMSVVFLTIAVVIMNTVLMTVLERTREFGTMLALGSKPGMIIRLVLLESAVVGIVGSLIGLTFGGAAAWAHSITGMSMKAHGMAAIPGTTDVVFPQVTWLTTLGPTTLLPIIVLLVSLYPATRAARLQPVQALRHV